jgi:hypothetical protein
MCGDLANLACPPLSGPRLRQPAKPAGARCSRSPKDCPARNRFRIGVPAYSLVRNLEIWQFQHFPRTSLDKRTSGSELQSTSMPVGNRDDFTLSNSTRLVKRDTIKMLAYNTKGQKTEPSRPEKSRPDRAEDSRLFGPPASAVAAETGDQGFRCREKQLAEALRPDIAERPKGD